MACGGGRPWETVRAMVDALRTVTYEVADRVARITLNRPERGNGITRLLIDELERCVERADLDPAVHVMLLAGNGKGFCGGYDLVESAEGAGVLGEGDPAPAPGSPLDPAVIAANHDPAGTWDAPRACLSAGLRRHRPRARAPGTECHRPARLGRIDTFLEVRLVENLGVVDERPHVGWPEDAQAKEDHHAEHA
jgi:Enoyl-CoA hydratase/isomerase